MEFILGIVVGGLIVWGWDWVRRKHIIYIR